MNEENKELVEWFVIDILWDLITDNGAWKCVIFLDLSSGFEAFLARNLYGNAKNTFIFFPLSW